MDENWTVNKSEEVERSQVTWDALSAGDPTPALASQADNVVFDNGPGAGLWRHTEGQDAFLQMMANFLPIFGDSFRQVGTCIFANKQFTITLVAETGTHDKSGATFDNRAVYVSRLDPSGNVDHVWTVDLDSEDMEQFWRRNPMDGS